MNCPKCGTENPDNAQLCQACSWVLTGTSIAAENPNVKTSALAITALVLAILSLFTFFLTMIPAMICGIVSLVKIEKSGGRLTGKGLAIVGIVLPVVLLPVIMMMVLMPALTRAREMAKASMCMSNLKQWGSFFAMYTDDYGGKFFEDENWLEPLRPYCKDEKPLLCPMAIKSQDEGGKIPFAAWSKSNINGSYGLNCWVINPPQGVTIGGRRPEYFWRSCNIKGAASVPVLFDCSSSGVWPLQSDLPPEYNGEPKGEGTDGNDMRDCCINRHTGTINGIFLDYSVRKIKLKELWMLKWHRGYPSELPVPDWPEWMKKFEDPSRY